MALEMELDETKARSRDEVGMGAVVQSLQRSLASAESEAAELDRAPFFSGGGSRSLVGS